MEEDVCARDLCPSCAPLALRAVGCRLIAAGSAATTCAQLHSACCPERGEEGGARTGRWRGRGRTRARGRRGRGTMSCGRPSSTSRTCLAKCCNDGRQLGSDTAVVHGARGRTSLRSTRRSRRSCSRCSSLRRRLPRRPKMLPHAYYRSGAERVSETLANCAKDGRTWFRWTTSSTTPRSRPTTLPTLSPLRLPPHRPQPPTRRSPWRPHLPSSTPSHSTSTCSRRPSYSHLTRSSSSRCLCLHQPLCSMTLRPLCSWSSSSCSSRRPRRHLRRPAALRSVPSCPTCPTSRTPTPAPRLRTDSRVSPGGGT